MGLQDEVDNLSDRLRDFSSRLRQQAERIRAGLDPNRPDSTAVAAFLRPNLGATPAPVRRFLEPIIAGAAAVVIAMLLGFGLYGFAIFFLSAGLIYLVLTHVFGLELDLNLPF